MYGAGYKKGRLFAALHNSFTLLSFCVVLIASYAINFPAYTDPDDTDKPDNQGTKPDQDVHCRLPFKIVF